MRFRGARGKYHPVRDRDSIQNLAFHFGQGQGGSFCDDLLQAIYTELRSAAG
jgi:hypothetical protein